MSRTQNSTGSVWHRWEPHIHAPGTLLNDQYRGMTLDEFCDAVEANDPPIRALGITDYYVTNSYQLIHAKKADGKLPNVDLLFPNIEIRLDIGTHKGSAVNAHLLFSPDDPNHIAEIERFLSRLTFRFGGNDYNCTRADLIRLGKDHNPQAKDDRSALRAGATQFKVSLKDLTDVASANTWVQENMLVAVAASSTDGSAGMKTHDGAFDALRATIEASCHIIFSGNPKDAEFWSGRGKLTPREIEAKYRTLKPCLHGCDAHTGDRIGKPDEDRFCWIKGDVSFETLRQACLEPAGRTFVGSAPPRGGLVGETVQRVTVSNAAWMVPTEVPLNPGLVAIIGARGSGKTALADAIAVGAYSMSAHASPRSFIRRAEQFLTRSAATLDWESGEQTKGPLVGFEATETAGFELVQYLSQQFVDELCASDGIADRLLDEIKRVIFNSHTELDREGALTFDELYLLTCRSCLDSQQRAEEEMTRLSGLFVEQTQLKNSEAELNKRIDEASKSIGQLQKEREGLVATGQEKRLARQHDVHQALMRRKAALEIEQKRARALELLKTDVADYRDRIAKAWLSNAQATRSDAGLTAKEWGLLLPSIDGTADELLTSKLAVCRKAATDILGPIVSDPPTEKLDVPLIADGTDLDTVTVNRLAAESQRLTKLVGIDKQKASRYSSLTSQITNLSRQVMGLQAQLKKAEAASSELKKLSARRKDLYRTTFESFDQLTMLLNQLYEPLAVALEDETGALSKIGFVVRRTADVAAWAEVGEELFDLRTEGPFKGRGSLKAAAIEQLVPAWEEGTAEGAAKAVDDFAKKYGKELRNHRLESIPYSEWLGRVWAWIYGIDHIRVTYSLQYGGVAIEKLSPGTRGIVLLLLYLALDHEDVRPLIIDQPEENLDPQSVYDELVSRFKTARERRQIVVVTHNANLVVNADADQVIVATAGEHQPGQLPEIRYEAGGLENPYIRGKVCEILEGGENAFRERARRLRVTLQQR